MRNLIILLILNLYNFVAKAQSVVLYEKFEELQTEILKNDDTTYVVNFWATWCKPCVEELPYFMESENELVAEKVKFVFVSLDFADQIEKRLLPFLKTKRIDNTVFLMADQDSNSWIPKVDKDWSGAIPATAMFKNGKQVFFSEKSFESTKELNTHILQHL